MFLLFLLFWGIAYFIFKSQFRTTALVWVSISIFFFGFGGLSALLQELPDNYQSYWFFPAAAASIAMLWGAYGLLMYSLHYTGKMPRSKVRQRLIEFLCAVPLIIFYFIIPALQMFGLQETTALQDFHTKVMTGFVTPYFVGSAILLTVHLFQKSSTVWRSETVTSYVLVVPASMTYYFTAFLIPCFGYSNLWRVSIVTILAESVLFLFLFVRKNAFGLFYYQRNATREQTVKSIIEGTRVLQHAMKNNLLAARLALQNAQYHYNQEQKDSEAIMNDIHLAYDSCEYSLAILERIHLKIYPVQLSLICCILIPIIEQVIDQSLKEYSDKNVQIAKEFKAYPHVYCDPVHIREVILNLVNNAMEAMPEDGSGKLTVSFEEVRGKAVLKISDNGHGIAKDQMKKLGIPLLTQKVEGIHYGLGLYYVKKVINMHDGQFFLRNTPNGGTTAEILLSAIRVKK